MTFYSIFNDCTSEDMNQHLFALAADSHHGLLRRFESSPSRVQMKITVDEVKASEETIKTSVRHYWLPGERITGTISIESKDPVTLAHARIRLDGVSRIHTRKVSPDGIPAAIPTLSAYKFLSQHQDLIPENGPVNLHTETSGVNTTVPFDFTISRLAMTKGTHVPQQCLQLPPTICVGPVLKDDVGDKRYAQPNIGYYLIAEAEIRNADQEPTAVTAIQEIPIWVSRAANPPLDTLDFPGEFVESQTLPCRPNRLRSDKYGMTLTTSEPPAVTFRDRKSQGIINSNVFIKIEDSRPGADPQRLMKIFRKAQVKVILGLRAKTFYSTRAFPKLPGQSMLTTSGPHRLYDQVIALPPMKQVVPCWSAQDTASASMSADLDGRRSSSGARTTDQEQCKNMSTSVFLLANVQIVTRVPMDLPPSFCSAVASRQYSLLLKVKISGARIKDFLLEVPVQIVYNIDDGHNKHNPSVAESLFSDSDTTVQGSTSRNSNDVLPGYAR